MSTVNLKVVSATASKNGGFIHKLQSNTTKVVKTVFGAKTQESQATYYMKLDEAAPIGMEAELDLSEFKVVDREFLLEDTGEIIMLKWIHLK